ncbi:MAG: hypothetical protein RSB61_04910, partial [Clostridia bacterium]
MTQKQPSKKLVKEQISTKEKVETKPKAVVLPQAEDTALKKVATVASEKGQKSSSQKEKPVAKAQPA